MSWGNGKLVIGVCAMDAKARGKPMRNILDRLISHSSIEVIIFGDQVILDEPIDAWPLCNVLFAFHSHGFPLSKAIAYFELRRPFCVNDLALQYLLLDRRLVYRLLEAIDVPTPWKLFANRPKDTMVSLPTHLIESVGRDFNVNLASADLFAQRPVIQSPDLQSLSLGTSTIHKPFVEKPADSQDHNINIYYPKSQGGGGRRLFRKINNKSSQYCPDLERIRGGDGGEDERSYIYERYIEPDVQEDVKVYTVGLYYAHAEVRKSPIVDGRVQRGADGKEVRKVTVMSAEEREIAKRVCMAFGQTVCGFDMIRSGGKSFVVDVNGWSFVKGNVEYYDRCARILLDLSWRGTALQRLAVAREMGSPISILAAGMGFDRTLHSPRARRRTSSTSATPHLGQWRLHTYLSVFRHADRTPKGKLKMTVSHPLFFHLLPAHWSNPTKGNNGSDGHESVRGVMIRDQQTLKRAYEITCQVAKEPCTCCRADGPAKDAGGESGVSTPIVSFRDLDAAVSNLSLGAGGSRHDREIGAVVKGRPHGCKRIAQLLNALRAKHKIPSTKMQLQKINPATHSMSLILKWGGEFTHAGRHQSKDVGENLRSELLIMNRSLLENVQILCSGERRVQATAEVFSKALMEMAEVLGVVQVKSGLLDDSIVDKDCVQGIKRRIGEALCAPPSPPPCTDDGDGSEQCKLPQFVGREKAAGWLKRLRSLMAIHRKAFNCHTSTKAFSPAKYRWCCGENAQLFQERWERHFASVLDAPLVSANGPAAWFDPSKISDLHDSLKFDLLHHKQYFRDMFCGRSDEGGAHDGPKDAVPRTDHATPETWQELCQLGQRLFDWTAPQEYGHTHSEKQLIGKQISGPLLSHLIATIQASMACNALPMTCLYFTKESHMTALWNLFLVTEIPLRSGSSGSHASDNDESVVNELDYLSHICIEMYCKVVDGDDCPPFACCYQDEEDPPPRPLLAEHACPRRCQRKRFSIRIGKSQGAHTTTLPTISLDRRHCVSVLGKEWLSDYLDADFVVGALLAVLRMGEGNGACK